MRRSRYNLDVGWGYRKSFGSKAFRVNVSKSGIGFSTGVKGFRVSTNRRGTFVNIGGGGIHYRQRIGGPYAPPRSHPRGAAQPSANPSPGAHYQGAGTGAVTTADAGQLVDQRSEQLLSAINETVTQPGVLRILLPIALVSTLASVTIAPPMPLIMGLLWLFPLIYVAGVDRGART